MESNVTSRFDGFNSHSQIVMQCHPMLASVRCSSRSRSLFRRIFATQKSLFVLGILQHPEFSNTFRSTKWPCQKHPFTKIHVLYFLSTKSYNETLSSTTHVAQSFPASCPSNGSPPYSCAVVLPRVYPSIPISY